VSAVTERRSWWLRLVLAAAMLATGAWVVDHGVAGIAFGAVAQVVGDVGAGHLALLALIWAGGLVMYCVVLSSAMPGLGALRTLTVNLTGSAVANSIPLGGAVATALNWRMLKGWGHSNAAFVAFSTVTNALAVLMKLVLPVVAVGCLVAASVQVPMVLWCTAIVCAALLAAAAATAVWLSYRPPSAPPARHRWLRRIEAFLAGSGTQIVAIVRRRWAWLLAGSLAYTGAQVVLLGVSLRAVGLVVPISTIVAAAAIERLGTVIPLTPGGAGVAEAGTVAWLIATGLDPTQAVAGVLLYRAFVVVMEIPVGGAVLAGWVWQNRGGPTNELRRPACASLT
jgi:putative heme transporter